MTTKATGRQLNDKQINANDSKAKEQVTDFSEQTLTLPSLVAATNQAIANPEEIKEKEEEEETPTSPKMATSDKDESETATLPSIPAYEHEKRAQTTLLPTALWTAIEGVDQANTEKEEKPLSTIKEAEVHGSEKTVVWHAVPKKEGEEQREAPQMSDAESQNTAVWPAASRTAPPTAKTALYSSVSNPQNVVLTISRSQAIFLSLFITFLNILVSVFIVLALLYQINGTLDYKKSRVAYELHRQVMQLERQTSLLGSEVKQLQEQVEQLEAQEKSFSDARLQIVKLLFQYKKTQDDLNQAECDISTLQEENDELEEKVSKFEIELAELQKLVEEIRLYQSKSLR